MGKGHSRHPESDQKLRKRSADREYKRNIHDATKQIDNFTI